MARIRTPVVAGWFTEDGDGFRLLGTQLFNHAAVQFPHQRARSDQRVLPAGGVSEVLNTQCICGISQYVAELAVQKLPERISTVPRIGDHPRVIGAGHPV